MSKNKWNTTLSQLLPTSLLVLHTNFKSFCVYEVNIEINARKLRNFPAYVSSILMYDLLSALNCKLRLIIQC